MVTRKDIQKLTDEIKVEFPDFTTVDKGSSRLMKFFDLALRITSFGKMNRFMTHFVTTLGNTVYLPTNWNEGTLTSQLATLRHERVHMRQSARLGRLKFSLLYALAPLPVLFSYYRMKFEMEAYEESIRTYAAEYGKEFLTPEVRENFIRHFTSSEYLWMWPWRSRIEAWYDDFVASLP
jgi:hypothetical protein